MAVTWPGVLQAQRPDTALSGSVKRALASDAFRHARVPGGTRAALPVTIRLRDAASLATLRRHPPSGLAIRAALGTVLVARASAEALRALEQNSDVLRIELDTAPLSPPPIAFTASEVQAPALWRAWPSTLTGKGVLVADIDTGIDVFHPAFFRRTDTYLAWIDVDGDGALSPGVDAVDLDSNGQVEATERLDFSDRRLFTDSSFLPVPGSDNEAFDVGDTLFVDSNGNGERDYGTDAGFAETAPTLGEPLLLVDDVNGNGVLDLGEKLVPQGASKIRAVFDGENEFRREQNLGQTPGRQGPYANHGTQVAGTVLGGDALLGDMVGLAPDAELLMGVYGPGQNFSQLLAWAVESGAKVVLHEYAPWTGYHLDGSSNYEHMLDAAAQGGVLHVNPVGNLGGSRKHARLQVTPQGSEQLTWRLPGIGAERIEMSILWREPQRLLEFALRTPAGDIVALGGSATELSLPGGGSLVTVRDDSTGGTAMYHMIFTGPAQVGDWLLFVEDVGGTRADLAPAQLSLYVADDRSGWGNGVRFLSSVSEEHLIGFPSSADSALGVAAYTGHGDFPINTGVETSGQNRAYSGRGTRIDGRPVIGISAPDNPFVATNERDFNASLGTRLGDMSAFSGTSGAAAHVAGAAALMAQANPALTMDEFRDALRAGAELDAQVTGNATHTREQLWGAGKLRVYRSIYGSDPPVNTSPTISIAPACAQPGSRVALVIEISDSEDATADLRLQFDDDYDGEWDAPPAPAAVHTLQAPAEPGLYFSKARALDNLGASRQALVELRVQAGECEGAPGESDAGALGPRHYPADCGCRVGARTRPVRPGPLLLFALLGGIYLVWRKPRGSRASKHQSQVLDRTRR